MGTTKSNGKYKTNVLDVNTRLKMVFSSLGGLRKVLLDNADEIKISEAHKILLEQSIKDKKVYEKMINGVRKTKNGGFNRFYLLQYLHRVTDGTLAPAVTVTKKTVKVEVSKEGMAV